MNYIDIINSTYFKDTYSKIEILKKDFPINHGFIHINNTIKNAKNLAKVFQLTNEETEILLVATALHDIGYLQGRENHALNGAVLAKDYLLSKTDIPLIDVITICRAISNHGGRSIEEYTDKITICLILADKMDFVASRYSTNMEEYPSYKKFLNVEHTEMERLGNKIVLNIYMKNGSDCGEISGCNYCKKLEHILKFVSQKQGVETEIKVKEINEYAKTIEGIIEN